MTNVSLKRMAIFDDDEDLLFIYKYIFEEDGWHVDVFIDCINIIDKVSAVNPAIILMDNWIPDTGGVIATQLLKANESLKGIPVIYVSANNDVSVLAKEAGANNFIAKPFNIDELKSIVNNLVNMLCF
ncbi:MAG: response regulator [Ferruginibacter sp.]|nr:response regulator [Ferruginibacter sp.]